MLLHPFPFSRGIWAGLADELAAHRRVITVDARGFGGSPLGAGATRSTDLADDLAALLDRLNIARATLLGMSMGGYTALAFAARHPKRLAALILADTRAAADSAETRAGRAAALDVIRRDGPAAYLASSLPRLLSPAAPAGAGRATCARAPRRAPPAWSRASRRCATAPIESGELAAIACPMLVVCGDGDQVTPPPRCSRWPPRSRARASRPSPARATSPTSRRRARSAARWRGSFGTARRTRTG